MKPTRKHNTDAVWVSAHHQRLMAVRRHWEFNAHGYQANWFPRSTTAAQSWTVYRVAQRIEKPGDSYWQSVAVYCPDGDRWYAADDNPAPSFITDQFDVQSVERRHFERFWTQGVAAVVASFFGEKFG